MGQERTFPSVTYRFVRKAVGILEDFYEFEKRRRDFSCSLGFAMTVIGSKWSAVILWHILRQPPIRYGELKNQIPHISHKILSQELKRLEMDRLVQRIAYPTIPPKVEYLPTEKGKSLKHILEELCSWGKQYMRSCPDSNAQSVRP